MAGDAGWSTGQIDQNRRIGRSRASPAIEPARQCILRRARRPQQRLIGQSEIGTPIPADPDGPARTSCAGTTAASMRKIGVCSADPNGAPDRNRTCNRRLRRPVLYPVELRAPEPGGPTRSNRAMVGRGRGIRTPDILLPKQARYQTALYPGDASCQGGAHEQTGIVNIRPRFCQTCAGVHRRGPAGCCGRALCWLQTAGWPPLPPFRTEIAHAQRQPGSFRVHLP